MKSQKDMTTLELWVTVIRALAENMGITEPAAARLIMVEFRKAQVRAEQIDQAADDQFIDAT